MLHHQPANSTHPPYCLMCGWLFSRGKGQRKVPIQTLRDRVRQQWRAGPVVFANIMAFPGPTAVCCATCMKRPGDGKTMLPMDSYLLHLIAPTHMPDLRRQKRMQTALTRTHKGHPNPYANPRWTLQIASSPDPTRAWWERNLSTLFFRHKHTARSVRLLLRNSEASAPLPHPASPQHPEMQSDDTTK